MRKSLLLVGLATLLSFPLIASAEADKTITLAPGWNVVSTPAILSSIEFSNQGEGISFSKLSNGAWISVPATVENIKPLEGFMVYSSNADDVTISLTYKKDVTPTEAVLQRNLNYGWDLLGIVTTNSPFNNIGEPAVMSLDFTDNGTTNYLNKVNDNYAFDSTSSNVVTPQLGEAYGIFINQQNAVYGGANGGGTSGGGSTSGGDTSECDAPLVVAVCSFDSDACPSNCRGDISVNYTNTTTQNVIIGGVSNLDQINIINLYGKTVSEITLKKYGYSSESNIETVWLEDLQGNKITNEKALNNQGVATFPILNGVDINANFGIRVVVKTNNTLTPGQNMLGFKVTNVVVDSQNNSFDDNESPYLYSAINYAASAIRVIPRGADATYNQAEGQYFEISKFRVTAQENTLLKGFELTNVGDLVLTNDNSDIIVELSSEEEITSLSTTMSNNKLIITFDDIEIPGSASIIITVKVRLIDFDQHGRNLQYSIADASDIRAEEETTGARVAVTIDSGWHTYTFEGGRMQFLNVTLGNIEATQGRNDVLIGQGNITVTEPIKLGFTITTQNLGVTGLYVEIDGVEYVGTESLSGDDLVFTFSNVEIEEPSTMRFFVDVDENATVGNTITFTTLSKNVITAKYGDTNNMVNSNNIAGSISLSNLKIKAAPQPVISTTVTRNTVLLKSANQTIANFIVRPNGGEYVDFSELVISGDVDGIPLTANDLTVRVNGVDYDNNGTSLTYTINEEIGLEGVTVEIRKGTASKGIITLNVVSINGISQNRTFTNKFVDALLYVALQNNVGGATKYVIGVEKYDSDMEVSNLKMYVDSNSEPVLNDNHIIENGDTFEVVGNMNTQMITKIAYDVTNGGQTETVEILKTEYPDYFKIGDTYIRIFKAD